MVAKKKTAKTKVTTKTPKAGAPKLAKKKASSKRIAKK